MKSVLISIQPKWCELIASGKKTVEVRKSKPKLDVPFKVYIYCTKGGEGNLFKRSGNKFLGYHYEPMQGKVIGEFVCDDIGEFKVFENGSVQYWNYHELGKTCLTYDELANYIGRNKDGYGWHISNLVIYDKPRALREFYKPCIDEEYQYCPCCIYGHEIFSPDEVECSADVPGASYEQICLNRVKTPPQSWCYVESEVQGE